MQQDKIYRKRLKTLADVATKRSPKFHSQLYQTGLYKGKEIIVHTLDETIRLKTSGFVFCPNNTAFNLPLYFIDILEVEKDFDYPYWKTNKDWPCILKITPEVIDEIQAALYFSSNEETRYYLNGIYVGSKGIAATDGHRMFFSERHKIHHDIIIPKYLIKIINSMGWEEGHFYYDGHNKIEYITKNYNIIFKTIDGTFPDFTRVVPTDNNIKLHLSKKILQKACDRAIAYDRIKKIKTHRIYFEGNFLHQEKGKFKVDMVAKFPCKIAMNPNYLRDILKLIKGDEVIMLLKNDRSPVLVNDNFIIMPMRA